MPTCERCASVNPAGFRFCGACGAPLAENETRHETRKVVTVLFSDATGWTSLSESRDPEALRAIMGRYFTEIRQTIERHGGTVEKFIGDAVMAVFGVPRLHEDDALRAVRAAAEIRERLPAVADAVGVTLRFRTGVNTGMVFTGEGESLAVGDAVNVAARLEQAAEPGEILLGEETFRLVADQVEASPLDPVTMKGKADPVPAFRLLRLRRDQTAARPIPRRPQLVPGAGLTSLVGRERELSYAQEAFARTAATREPHLLTVVGEAGIGKSRLVQELIGGLADQALVLVGRCLSYGEGIAFWPLREALTQAAGGESRDAIRTLLAHAEDADLAADVISSTLGLTPAEPVSEQVPWAFQRLLETPRRQRSMLLVIEDAHWAEDPLLELLEYLVRRLTAPALVLCLARPELLDRRPAWRGAEERFSSLSLGPLDRDDARRLLGDAGLLQENDAAAILRAAEGNPLFVEQLLAMRAEQGWGRTSEAIPVTIQSLLAARIDHLSRGERELIETAAVVGREFPPSAVIELTGPGSGDHLPALSERGLIGPAQSSLSGEEQLSFRHILIRDVAYSSTAKTRRAELHEQFADWLGRSVDGHDEFVGYHLEQAVRHRLDLGQRGDGVPTLAARAGDHLAAVGRRALARGEANAASNLLRRATDMHGSSGRHRADVLLDLGRTLVERGDYDEAQVTLERALSEAQAGATEALAARASIELSFLHVSVDPSVRPADIEAVAHDAIAVFERTGDQAGLARALIHLGDAHLTRCRFSAMEEVLERALRHVDNAGQPSERPRILTNLAGATVIGPRPVADGMQRCLAIMEQADDHVRVGAFTGTMLAVLEAMDGRFDSARERWSRSRRRLEDAGLDITVSLLSPYYAHIELLAGTPERAEDELRAAYSALERAGGRTHLATHAALLGRLLCAQGRHEQARPYLAVSEQVSSEEDVGSQVLWRGTRAVALAHTGDGARAVALAAGAVERAAETDCLMLHADALRDRAQVWSSVGRPVDAARDLDRAIELYEQKGIRPSAVAAGEARRAVTATPIG